MVRGEKSGPEKDDADQHGDRRCDGAEHGVIVLPMPKLSHAMTSGRIAKWHVEEGASVNTYDVLLTVETETLVEEAYRLDQFAGKVALLVESQEEGFVARLLAAEGEEVPVGKPIALLCEREDEVPAARASIEWARLGDVYDSTCNPREVGLPGGVYTPTSAVALPSRETNRSLSSLPSDVASYEVPYKFTLVDLNARSYFLIHEVPDTTASSPSRAATATTSGCTTPLPDPVARLRDALRQAVLLANIEVCIVRNYQLAHGGSAAGSPAAAAITTAAVDLTQISPSDPPESASALARRAAENTRALGPVAGLLSKCLQPCSRKDVARILEERIQAAEQLLGDAGTSGGCGEGLAGVEDCQLQELAFTFAAYQPAVLDEGVKGSQSPCDPRSHTRSIADVAALVEGSAREAGTTMPEALARLAVRLLDAVRLRRPNTPLAGWLLQGACMSGHYELVAQLLYRRSAADTGLYELDIIRRLRTAWLGYTRYRPLQPVRSGAKAHTIDWLDFKCSCARAVLIAHKVIETLILRDDKELTLSVQMTGGTAGAAAPPRPAAPPSFSLAVAAADAAAPGAADGGGGAEGEAPPQSGKLENDRERRVVVVAPGVPAAAASVACGSVDIATRGRLLDDDSDHVELEPSKWAMVRELFPRAAACKPLALAMLHVVLAGKREVQQAVRAAAAAAAAARSQSSGAGASAELPLPPPLADGVLAGLQQGEEDDEEEAAAEAEAERERQRAAEELRSARYRKLHLLAVQACHLAVHSGSLSTVSDAIACIRAVRAWPAIDLAMLNDLAETFPHQCASLLGAIPLQEVDLEDNVLPFGLPPGFTTVAVSDKDAHEFRQGGGTGSTQDAEHFATQREADASIEASLLVLPRTWLALLFLFWPAEFASPATRQLLRVLRCAVAAFLWQGPGSCAVAVVFWVLLAVVGVATRSVVAVVRILYYGILYRIWAFMAVQFPAVRQLAYRIRGRRAAVGPVMHSPTGIGGRIATMRHAPGGVGSGAAAVTKAGGGDGGDVDEDDGDGDGHRDDGNFTRQLGRGIWRTFFAHGHNALIDKAVGWGRGAASISCRKVPMPITYTSRYRAAQSQSPGSGPGAGGGGRSRQLDTALLEKLLNVPGLHPSVFGSKVLRALILFKWNYFTKYFIILQLLLHISYMAVFLAYAFTIKDMELVEGRDSGPGAHTRGCRLEAPSATQTGLLIVLAVMTVDFLIRHFGLLFFTHMWDVLDVCSVSLVVASVALHFSCTLDVSPLTLRGLASVQIVLLFMRLLYYAMASDKLGSFVRMVLETTYDLVMFFAFLGVVFVGFALAMIVSQGSLANEEQTFIKLFTMMYGDFDVNFLSDIESGALGLDALTRVIASVYMILVTIILLNLLISIISESYERIRENERWESLRNKALLVVECETQLWAFFLDWLYTTLTPPSAGDSTGQRQVDNGKRYLYVIAPEYARRTEAAGDEDDEDEEDDDDGGEDEDDDGQWNGRLGEMKRHITAQSRATADLLRREVGKVLTTVESVMTTATAAATAAAAAEVAPHNLPDISLEAAATAETGTRAESCGEAGPAKEPDPGYSAGRGNGSGGGSAAVLDEHTVQLLAEQVGTLLRKDLVALRKELLTEIAKAGPPPQQHQQQQQGHGGRLSPLTSATAAMASLPPLAAVGAAASGRPASPSRAAGPPSPSALPSAGVLSAQRAHANADVPAGKKSEQAAQAASKE
ncbi:hypothetical protein VOLCADRAFT_86312 [Volvox carteri f. nagariensis]|uniref:Ion transport domain-containing protein n=1 Tax=Volvox carteri f. nagariensis TaxID=3068 RepID=D8TIF7_VOLCA|nr:uncharacterized protein VOLCADRAFT_86312 [Volvox carteri f. nagariensis]EFJ52883.1 hypothetical protein VOLCADRAFT_86312 [Volvox carteri f. nagariensis]|eukprot:XP_002945888.1 hypothetical protein VOLCADRAFT_86312 [Volvox carteri f. nagariensis]